MIDDVNTQIASATAQQGASATAMHANVAAISDVSQRAANATEQAAGAGSNVAGMAVVLHKPVSPFNSD